MTKLTYIVPQGRSALEVYRSYKQALHEAGFEVLFSTTDAGEIGPYEAWHAAHYGDGPEHRGHLLRSPQDDYYIAARLAHPEGDVYAAIYILFSDEGRDYPYNVRVQADIIEEGTMEEGLVRADTMEQRLDIHGSVAIHGIHFDFDSAELLPESDETLAEIAGLLADNDELELYVVGHTDDVGDTAYNLELSERRAEAVVEALVEDYGVASHRLTPFGVGPTAPAASNETEEGRAQNRRVELVQRAQ